MIIIFFILERSTNECVNVLLYWLHVIQINAPQRCNWQKRKEKKKKRKQSTDSVEARQTVTLQIGLSQSVESPPVMSIQILSDLINRNTTET